LNIEKDFDDKLLNPKELKNIKKTKIQTEIILPNLLESDDETKHDDTYKFDKGNENDDDNNEDDNNDDNNNDDIDDIDMSEPANNGNRNNQTDSFLDEE